MVSKDFTWNHSLGEVITSLANAGLTIDCLNEYDATPYDIFPDLIKNKNGMFEFKTKKYPLVFEVKATKK